MNESKIYKGLLQERASLIDEGKQIFERAERESRELTAEEKGRDDEINARLGELKGEIARHEVRRERERQAPTMGRIEVHERIEDDPSVGLPTSPITPLP